jgi:CHAT domain-containing protein/tetratricopeptide (TPR) repeat protein
MTALQDELGGPLRFTQGLSHATLAEMEAKRDRPHAVLRHREMALAAFRWVYGEQHGRTIQARWDRDNAHRELAMSAADRKRLREADRLLAQTRQMQQTGRAGAALPLAQRIVRVYGELYGKMHPRYAVALDLLASALQNTGQPGQAIPHFKEALAISLATVGLHHTDYALGLNNLARAYQVLGELDHAFRLYQGALVLIGEAIGTDNPVYLKVLNNLAFLYSERSEYSRARPLYRRILDLYEQHEDQGLEYAIALNNLARVYQNEGDFRRALGLFERARRLLEQVDGGKHPYHARALLNLGTLYMQTGEDGLAQQRLRQAVELLRDNPLDHATALNNLAVLYQHTGDHRRALALFRQALQVIEKAVGTDHPSYATAQVNLSGLHREMGEDEEAIRLTRASLTVFARTPGKMTPLYATTLNNLALMLRNVALMEQARHLRERALGKNHPDYAEALENLATLYQETGKTGQALPLLKEALAVREAVASKLHVRYAIAVSNLGLLHGLRGEYQKALPLLDEAVALHRRAGRLQGPYFATALHNLAFIRLAAGQPDRVEKLLVEAMDSQHRYLDDTFSALSDRERLQLAEEAHLHLDTYLAATTEQKNAAAAHTWVLRWKGMVGVRQAEEALVRDRPELAGLVRDLRRARAGLGLLAGQSPARAEREEWVKRFRALEKEKETLQRRLVEKSATFRRQRDLDSAALAGRLPPGVAFVDVLEYTAVTQKKDGGWNSEARLAAFVLARGRAPVRVELGPAGPIDEAVQAWRRSMRQGDAVDREAARTLRQRVWEPLARHLGGCKTVVIAPDGALTGLSFAALPGQKAGTFLVEELAVATVPSGRLLLALLDRDGPATGSGLLVLGGAKHGKAPRGRIGLRDLPGTLREAQNLRKQYHAAFPNEPVVLLKEEEADRAHLLRAVDERPGKWRWLHLATHGFFAAPVLEPAGRSGLPFPVYRAYLTSVRNPLLLSGIVLTGYNRAREQGTLTAEEVQALDLRGCELVTLSACETGLGTVFAREGVLGLRQAFHQAGARTVIASLWQVPDEATAALMRRFYDGLWQKKGLSRLEALVQAQRWLLKWGARHPLLVSRGLVRRSASGPLTGRGSTTRDDRLPPFFWASFVLSGDWR